MNIVPTMRCAVRDLLVLFFGLHEADRTVAFDGLAVRIRTVAGDFNMRSRWCVVEDGL